MLPRDEQAGAAEGVEVMTDTPSKEQSLSTQLDELVEQIIALKKRIADIGQPISQSELAQLKDLGVQYGEIVNQLEILRTNKNH